MNSSPDTRWIALLVLSLSFLLSVPGLRADDEEKQADPLPTAERIVEQMIAAEGGRAAMEKITTRTILGNFEFIGMGMTANFSSWNAGDGRYRDSMSIPGMGSFEKGILGEISWSHDPIQGGRILEGIELDLQRRSSHLSPLLHLEEDYEKIETVGSKEIDGQLCFELLMTPKVGEPETWFIRGDNFLAVRTEMTVDAPAVGRLKMVMEAKDYQEIDGIRLPHLMIIEQAGQNMTLKITKYEHNLEISGEKFELPQAVQKLVDKQKEKAAEGSEPKKEPAENPVGAGSTGG